jgi:hypothetical protein
MLKMTSSSRVFKGNSFSLARSKAVIDLPFAHDAAHLGQTGFCPVQVITAWQ